MVFGKKKDKEKKDKKGKKHPKTNTPPSDPNYSECVILEVISKKKPVKYKVEFSDNSAEQHVLHSDLKHSGKKKKVYSIGKKVMCSNDVRVKSAEEKKKTEPEEGQENDSKLQIQSSIIQEAGGMTGATQDTDGHKKLDRDEQHNGVKKPLQNSKSRVTQDAGETKESGLTVETQIDRIMRIFNSIKEQLEKQNGEVCFLKKQSLIHVNKLTCKLDELESLVRNIKKKFATVDHLLREQNWLKTKILNFEKSLEILDNSLVKKDPLSQVKNELIVTVNGMVSKIATLDTLEQKCVNIINNVKKEATGLKSELRTMQTQFSNKSIESHSFKYMFYAVVVLATAGILVIPMAAMLASFRSDFIA